MDVLQQLENKGFRVTVGIHRLLAKLDGGHSVPVVTIDGTPYLISLHRGEAHIQRDESLQAEMSFPILIEPTGTRQTPRPGAIFTPPTQRSSGI